MEIDKFIVFGENSWNIEIIFIMTHNCDDSKMLKNIQWPNTEVLSAHQWVMLFNHAIDYYGNGQLPKLDFIQFGDWKKLIQKLNRNLALRRKS